MKLATVALLALNVALMVAVWAQLRRLNDRLDAFGRRRTTRRRRAAKP